MVARAFATRRKTLRNALKGIADVDTLAEAGIDPGARAEQLAPADFRRLADRLAKWATIPDAESYRATVIVNRNGIVTSLAVNYTLPDSDGDGAREHVQFGLSYESLDTTTVAEPAWLPEAKNETSESSSA